MTTHTLTVRKATDRDLLFFSTPELWPLRPFLPIVRYKPDGEMDCGILYDVQDKPHLSGYSSTVFLTNVFQLPANDADFLTLPSEVFDTVEEMAAAGWVVD